MPVLVRTIDKQTEGDDTIVTVRVTSLKNRISSKMAATRGAARAIIEAGLIDPREVDPVKSVFELNELIETENQKIIEGEGINAIRTAEITFRVKR